jgi:hypothetical protein
VNADILDLELIYNYFTRLDGNWPEFDQLRKFKTLNPSSSISSDNNEADNNKS